MIKHIVLWKLKDEAHGNNKQTNAMMIKEMLESLRGKIEGLISIEVGIDLLRSEESADVALYSIFENQKALDHYQTHPEHKKMLPFIADARYERRVIDYEIGC